MLAVVSHFATDFFVSFLNPLAPYFMQRFNVGVKEIALLITSVSFFSSIFQIVFGMIASKLESLKRGLLVSMLLTIGAMAFVGFSPSISALLLLFLAAFFGNSAFHPIGAVMARGSSPYFLSIFVAAGTLGTALGPIFVTQYVSRYSFEKMWIVSLIAAIVFLFLYLREPDRGNTSRVNDGVSFRESLRGLSKISVLWFIVTVRTLIISLSNTYGPIIASKRNLPLVFGGLLLSLGVGLGVATTLLGTWMSERFGNHITNVVSFGGMAIGVLILSFPTPPIGLILGYLLVNGCGYLTMSTNVAHAQQLMPENAALASSTVMGFAWACGVALRYLLILPLGENITAQLVVLFVVSMLMVPISLLKVQDSKASLVGR
ncbi:MAG: MFS transporter [Thermotoga caldifontis]|uniref:MFS transporter n=1 Tax=Thermotoga caldifontis TaxID=1508419 RepID=UPI003C7DF9F0